MEAFGDVEVAFVFVACVEFFGGVFRPLRVFVRASVFLLYVKYGVISVFAVRFKHSPPPNLPRGRGRSRGSLPARGEGWGGGYV